MAELTYPPGSPEFWLHRLSQGLLDRQPRYDLLERYVVGNHPLPTGDARYVKALRELQQKSKTNYISLVTNAPCERMEVVGFRFGDDPDDSADDDAKKIWEANDMDLMSVIAHTTAATFSRCYVLVSPPFEPGGEPIITVEDPRITIVEHDPASVRKIRAGLRMWHDDVIGHAIAVVYLPDSIHYFRGNLNSYYRNIDYDILRERVTSAGSWTLVASAPNPIGEVPIVPLNWRPGLHGTSMAEAEEGFTIQDRINSTVLDRMIISRSQAYKQRWASGVKIPRDDSGRPKAPFDPGSDILWITEDKDSRFGEFQEADIRQILEAVRDDVGDLAAITKTPPHYLLGEIVNASGDALKAAETGLVAKTKQRIKTAGWSWEKVMRLCFAYKSDERAKSEVAETIWADPESRSRAELADAILKETQIGLPPEMAFERLGLTPTEITRAMALMRAKEMRDAMLMAAQTSMAPQKPGQTQPGQKPANNQPKPVKEE